jgi:hypothetical protein
MEFSAVPGSSHELVLLASSNESVNFVGECFCFVIAKMPLVFASMAAGSSMARRLTGLINNTARFLKEIVLEQGQCCDRSSSVLLLCGTG